MWMLVMKTVKVNPLCRHAYGWRRLKNIVEREVKASVYEVEEEHIDARELHCNMDGEDDGKSPYDET